jgi:hypothetical protein
MSEPITVFHLLKTRLLEFMTESQCDVFIQSVDGVAVLKAALIGRPFIITKTDTWLEVSFP